MKTKVKLTAEHVGKYVVLWARTCHIPAQITAVGDGKVVVMTLDPEMPLRSAKMRYDPQNEYLIYDTAEEAVNWDKE